MEKEISFLENMEHKKLTRAQATIAEYIMKNEKRVLGMTSMEVGKEVGVSDASVIRFCRAAGYEGFTDLKIHLQKELQKRSEKIGKHSLHDRFVMQTEKYQIDQHSENHIIKLMGMNLETSLRQNSLETYERVVRRILQSNRKIVIGLRGGKGCAIQFARLLGHMTDHVHSITEESNDLICKLTELDEKDVIVFLNFQRYYKIDEKLAELIRRKKIPCILITENMASPVTKCAEEVLLTETEHCGFFHSMLGVMGILEYLLILICRKNPVQYRERLKERDAILADYMVE